MKEATVTTFVETAEAQQRLRPRSTGRSGRVFVTLLFAVLALFLLVALLTGMNVYRAANDVRTASDESRLGLSLIANSLRMNDQAQAVGFADGPEGRALILTEYANGIAYQTRLYAYQGSIVEEYARADTAFTPEKARAVVASNRFDFTYQDGLLTVVADQGETCVALRSVQGGA